MGLNIGPWIVAVDPGTLSLGVCVSNPSGEVHKTYSIKAVGPLDGRLRVLFGGVRQVFTDVERYVWPEPWKPSYPEIELVIEEGVYRGGAWSKGRQGDATRTAAMQGEARGIVMAEAFRRGWSMRRMVPLSWKSMLTKAERSMKKDKKYVEYWDGRLGLGCRTPDEIDAVHIARKAVAGRR